MSKFILTSTGFHTDKTKAVFLKKMKGRIENSRVSIITTASPLKEQNTYAQKAYNDFSEMGFESIHFVDVEFDDPNILLSSDVIYINGGNPFHLLFHFKKSGSEKVFKSLSQQDTIFIGVSAGAIVLGPNLQLVHHFTPNLNTVNLKDLTCLGCVESLIFPHYGREDIFKDDTGKTIEERLSDFESLHNCLVHRIKEDEFILLEV